MKVANLQGFLRSLSEPLESAGAKAVAQEVQRVTECLQAFRDQSLKEFADFLIKAEEYARTGVLASAGRSRTRPAAAPSVEEAAQRVLALYERAADPDLQYGTIDAEMKALDKALNKDQAVAVAKQVGITKSLGTKKAALQEIRRKIEERKESFERIQFRPNALAPSGNTNG